MTKVGDTLVFHDDQFAIYWQGSTFNVYQNIGNDAVPVDCFTVNDVSNSSDAIWHARDWMDNFYKELTEHA